LQEILLSLGRKRLVEARKAASQHRAQMTRKGLLALERQAQLRLGNETRDQACATGSSILLGGSAAQIPQSTASRLSERIRSDVFGLKRAIRKSLKDSKRFARWHLESVWDFQKRKKKESVIDFYTI